MIPSRTPATTFNIDGDVITTNASLDSVGDGVGYTLYLKNHTVTIQEPGVYALSGKSSDLQVIVDVDKTKYPDGVVELDLEGLELTSQSSAPIYVANIGDEVQIVAKKDTVNVLSDGTSHAKTYFDSDGTEHGIDGVIFARDDIKLKGSGSLTLNGNVNFGIFCKNDLKIYNGNINIVAKDDAIRGKDSVTIGKADDTDYSSLDLVIKSLNGDGIKSTAADEGNGVITINGGSVEINAYADGIQAEQELVINGGDINIYTYTGSGYTASGTNTGNTGNTGGGWGGGMGMDGNSNKTENSAKGIKTVGLYDAAGTTWQSGGNITVNGGNITIDSSDDAVHAAGDLVITGGQFKLASADDALHADHDLVLGTKGGDYSDFGVYVTKCYEGVEGMTINQYSGTVVVKAGDDGYNAAGGADGSGTQNNGGFFPGGGGWGGGGFPGGGSSSGSQFALNIEGGIAIVQSASGDHDAFDSNGNLNVSGGIVIANGNEPLDAGDGFSTSVTGGNVLSVSQSSNIASGTQFTVADSNNNVIVSFKTMQAMGTVGSNHTDTTIKVYTGGTVSGGTDLIKLDSSQPVYASGTISGGTAVTVGTATTGGGPGGGGFNPGGRG